MKKQVKDSVDLTIDMVEGIGPTTKTKLRSAGIYSVTQLAVADPHQLTIDMGGKDRDVTTTYIVAAQKLLRDTNVLEDEFISGNAALEKRKDLIRCTTGSAQLDLMFKGGIETHSITEFYGEYGSGKSQICHTLCVLAQLPVSEGGFGGDVIVLDTEGTFRPERVEEIAIARGLDPVPILERVHISKIYNSSTLELKIKEMSKYIEQWNAKLVIVDSVMTLHRAEYTGMGTLAGRQQRLNPMMHQMIRDAEIYKVAMVVTNQVMDAPATFFGDPKQPVGGNIIGHASTYRVYLRKSGENRVAKMIDSPYHPYSEVKFTVKNVGVTDSEDKKKKLAEGVEDAEAIVEQ